MGGFRQRTAAAAAAVDDYDDDNCGCQTPQQVTVNKSGRYSHTTGGAAFNSNPKSIPWDYDDGDVQPTVSPSPPPPIVLLYCCYDIMI